MLTERIVRDAKSGGKTSILWDNQVKGLGLRISTAGTKTYVLSYRINGRKRIASLPRASEISLKAVRELAGNQLVKIRMERVDPLEVKQEAREAPTVSDGLEKFFHDYAPIRIRMGKLKASTLNEYRKHSTRYVEPVLGKLKIADVDKKTVERIVNPLTKIQRNRVLAFTQRLFNFFIEEGLRTSANPCSDIERAKEEPRDRVLSSADLTALANALNQHEKTHPAAVAAIRVAAMSGLRIGEILKIQWQHIDFETGRLTLPDTKSGRRVHSLPKSVLDIISNLKKSPDCRWVFTTRGKAPITYKVVRARLAAAAKTAGLEDVRLHDFRRTAMTLLAASGAPAQIIQQFVGHSTIDMAMRYVQAVNQPLHEAREDIANTVEAAMMKGEGEAKTGNDYGS